ncbi:dTMP kinase [Fusobacterium pseudoperiodonticum]|uniref:dTMP kinase n=1 Tax=Fusobacterium pseudoperiodonticum TaxID=2663009 RepID=UPI001313E584|nr:dTMP kinase [Fusobacterium pseudoperiodonticum]
MKKNTTKGFFVAIDGPNGVGKTTLLEEIEKIIKSKNIQLYKTKEPTNSILGNFIREISEEINGDTLACLVSADRYEHLKNEIIPELEKGKIVITDRYVLSSLILQVIDGVKENFILNLNSQIIKPDLQLAIFADEKVIQERLDQRETLTRFEKNNQSKKEINNMKKGIEKLRKLNIEVLCINNNNDLEYNANKIADYIIENWRKK